MKQLRRNWSLSLRFSYLSNNGFAFDVEAEYKRLKDLGVVFRRGQQLPNSFYNSYVLLY